jgi:hypothetical protein
MTIVRADVRSAQDPYARRRANYGQSTDDSPRCLPPAPGKAGIGAVGGMSRCGPSGYGGPVAGTLTGLPPLPCWSRPITRGLYPGRDPPATQRVTPQCPQRVRSTTPHPTRITQLGVNRCHSTGDALLSPAYPTALIIRR